MNFIRNSIISTSMLAKNTEKQQLRGKSWVWLWHCQYPCCLSTIKTLLLPLVPGHRELAIQIAEQFRALAAGMTFRDSVIIGGVDMQAQARELARRPHVVIATPGRLRVRTAFCSVYQQNIVFDLHFKKTPNKNQMLSNRAWSGWGNHWIAS
jgi:hypothetical protein